MGLGWPIAVGAVLAGGEGRRLGGAKAMVELDGKPLIAFPITAVAEAGMEPLVVAKPGTELPALPCRSLREPEQPQHPLSGLVAALREPAARPLVAVACDMPFLTPALLSHLAAATEPLVLPELDGELHPFPGRYEPSLLPELETALAAGEPLRETLARLEPRRLDAGELSRFGSPENLLFNVNTPSDLERARRSFPPPRSAP